MHNSEMLETCADISHSKVKIGFDPFRCHLFDNKGISFKNS